MGLIVIPTCSKHSLRSLRDFTYEDLSASSRSSPFPCHPLGAIPRSGISYPCDGWLLPLLIPRSQQRQWKVSRLHSRYLGSGFCDIRDCMGLYLDQKMAYGVQIGYAWKICQAHRWERRRHDGDGEWSDEVTGTTKTGNNFQLRRPRVVSVIKLSKLPLSPDGNRSQVWPSA